MAPCPFVERDGVTKYEPLASAGNQIFEWKHSHIARTKVTVRVGEYLGYVLKRLGMLISIGRITEYEES